MLSSFSAKDLTFAVPRLSLKNYRSKFADGGPLGHVSLDSRAGGRCDCGSPPQAEPNIKKNTTAINRLTIREGGRIVPPGKNFLLQKRNSLKQVVLGQSRPSSLLLSMHRLLSRPEQRGPQPR